MIVNELAYRWQEEMAVFSMDFSRENLIHIISLNIFNMSTICKLTGINYQTYRDSKAVDFSNMSDERVSALLKTIYTIVKYY